MASDDAPPDAVNALYAAPISEFMSLRRDLAATAKANGDPVAAQSIARVRKPTLAASLVNRLILTDLAAVERLRDLHTRLSAAHNSLDAASMRVLSVERRALVSELVEAASALAGQDSPSTGQRDELSSTFDAAVADPDIAERLGRLTKSERFSGFGPVSGAPELTLLPGGKRGSSSRSSRANRTPDADTSRSDGSATSSAARRRVARVLDTARAAFDTASQRLSAAESAERDQSQRVATLTSELAELQRDLAQAKRDQDAARRETKAARAQRRQTRSTLDQAERRLGN